MPQQHTLQLAPQTHYSLGSRDKELVLSPCICLSYTESSPQILSKEPTTATCCNRTSETSKEEAGFGLSCTFHGEMPFGDTENSTQ